jgi:hypothetical protein
VRKSIEAWAGCVAGALLDQEYRDKLAAAGFVKIDIEPTRVYTKDDAQQLVSSSSCCGGEVAMTFDLAEMDGAVMSAFVRASKP